MFEKTYVRGLNKDKVIASCFYILENMFMEHVVLNEKPSVIKYIITEVLLISKMIMFPDHFLCIL